MRTIMGKFIHNWKEKFANNQKLFGKRKKRSFSSKLLMQKETKSEDGQI